jgi:tRNA (cytidine56-2'-O)-methyltransferase
MISVLRIGHRPDRDKRITTHVALVARAFGAGSIFVDTSDRKLEETVSKVTSQFGGPFRIETGISFKKVMGKWKGTIVHLTMYGIPVGEALIEIPSGEDLLIVVGSEKVPREVYDLSHFNVSVTSQPHSEVAALAVFLDRLHEGSELRRSFEGGTARIVPSRKGKTVIDPSYGEMPPREPPIEVPPVPDEERCRDILERVGCSTPVIAHAEMVHSMGMDMVRSAQEADPSLPDRMDIPLVRAGLLLHDIGRSRTHSVRHVTLGAELAKRLGLDDRLVDIIHNHIGAGVSAAEAGDIGLPPEDHLPRTIEEMIVAHADNLIGGGRRITLDEAVNDLRRKGANEGAERMIELHRRIEEFLRIDIDALIRGRSGR